MRCVCSTSLSDPADADKRDHAIALLDHDDGALSVQVLQEFYIQATCPSRPAPLSHALAVDFITKLARFPVQDIALAILHAALDIEAERRLSYWDSAIIAAARADPPPSAAAAQTGRSSIRNYGRLSTKVGTISVSTRLRDLSIRNKPSSLSPRW